MYKHILVIDDVPGQHQVVFTAVMIDGTLPAGFGDTQNASGPRKCNLE